MLTVWKWLIDPRALDRHSITVLEMPAGAVMLTVDTQGDDISLWALVDPDRPKVARRIAVHGTGHPIPGDPGPYIGTFQLMGGALVFHVFDKGIA